ncbi:MULTISPECIES: hypothetical protein [unclassified Coleofasciculus]|uniref:hypothetical protein n=1 Tax=unclassified Coleofasciculus TaxID=2692782 RepID=UPI00187E2937|nr:MULTISPECIES: hypothetical protein [unclassified Coleofasciculus]MBE9126143.1 hypothetical protein [Coleofasciculus sp. LEGE 07081]MBE9149561.1 hypothetical protein [Coleofasciculus sp. LEGE 07092]
MKFKKLNSAELLIQADSLKRWISISLILLVATALYLYQLGTESLWIDELYSVHDAKNGNVITILSLHGLVGCRATLGDLDNTAQFLAASARHLINWAEVS